MFDFFRDFNFVLFLLTPSLEKLHVLKSEVFNSSIFLLLVSIWQIKLQFSTALPLVKWKSASSCWSMWATNHSGKIVLHIFPMPSILASRMSGKFHMAAILCLLVHPALSLCWLSKLDNPWCRSPNSSKQSFEVQEENLWSLLVCESNARAICFAPSPVLVSANPLKA